MQAPKRQHWTCPANVLQGAAADMSNASPWCPPQPVTGCSLTTTGRPENKFEFPQPLNSQGLQAAYSYNPEFGGDLVQSEGMSDWVLFFEPCLFS